MAARRTTTTRLARLGAALALVATAAVGLAPPTGADQVHLELSSFESMELPSNAYGGVLAVADDGTVLGTTLPGGISILWPGGSPTGVLLARPGAITTSLNDLNDEGMAAGSTALLGAQPMPVTYDIATGVWSDLPLAAGLVGSASSIDDLGRIYGQVGDDATGYVARWDSPTTAPETLADAELVWPLSDGRVLVRLTTPWQVAVWDPSDSSVQVLTPPIPGEITQGDARGRFLISGDSNTTTVWDSVTGALYPFGPTGTMLTQTGFALGWQGDTWVVVDLDHGTTTDVRPFDTDLPVIGSPVLADDGRVMGAVDDAGTTRVFVWSATEHSVELLDFPTGGSTNQLPQQLTSSGVAVGMTSVGGQQSAFWRATFRLAPDAPEDLAGEADGASVSLNWEAPPSDGDAPIQSYRVLVDGQVVAEVMAAETAWSGVASGTATYSVVAVNTYGESPPSNAVVLAAAVSPTVVNPAFTG